NIRQIDVDHCRVFRVSIGFQQLRIRQPFFHALDTTLQGTAVALTLRDHPPLQNQVGGSVINATAFFLF
ncbi:hypothetical protein, partial [uncultured Phyllobacterium sp.]|uniref:hypothetical protein n=1 Tax=uncultured Phyllobacterium sp. TaxID=253813 RepID=UPI00258561AA